MPAVNVLDRTSLLQTFGVLGVFLVFYAKTGLLVGFFLPGDSLLFTAGPPRSDRQSDPADMR